MIIPSHTALAARLHDYMAMNHGCNLATNAFYRGSIAPDLGEKEKGSHYGERCLDHIEKILRDMDDADRGDLQEFSYQLGLISHYVADYFTNAHNKGYLQTNMRLHMLYELRLHWVLNRSDRKPVYNFKLLHQDILVQLRLWHEEYLLGRAGVERDIHFILMSNHYVVERLLAKRGLALGLLSAA